MYMVGFPLPFYSTPVSTYWKEPFISRVGLLHVESALEMSPLHMPKHFFLISWTSLHPSKSSIKITHLIGLTGQNFEDILFLEEAQHCHGHPSLPEMLDHPGGSGKKNPMMPRWVTKTSGGHSPTVLTVILRNSWFFVFVFVF